MRKPPVDPMFPTSYHLFSLFPFGFSNNLDQNIFVGMIGAKPNWSGFKREKEKRCWSQ